MKSITATQTAITIPFEILISLYDKGYLDPALLAYCLPIAIAQTKCLEVLKDAYEIDKIANILGNK